MTADRPPAGSSLRRSASPGSPEEDAASPREGAHRSTLELLFELSDDMLAVLDRFGVFIELNPSWARLLGRPLEELRGTTILPWLHPDDLPRNLAHIAMLAERRPSEPVEFENRIIDAEGVVHWIAWSSVVGPDDRYYCRATDVTERRELGRVAASHTGPVSAEQANADLRGFMRMISHDLYEPLRTVSSFSELLETRYAERLGEDGRRFVHQVRAGASRMRTLIGELSAYVQSPVSSASLEPVETGDLLAEVVDSLGRAVDESGAQVILRGEFPRVQGDPAALMQLFQNLIANALRFRSDQPPVVTLGARPYGPGWLFSVEDNGLGIDPADTEAIFLPFQRGHEDQLPGMGMGLAICRRIVEAHGGRIWAKERRDGATICFTLGDAGTADLNVSRR